MPDEAAAGLEAETAETAVDVTWKDLTFRVLPATAWPIKVLRLVNTKPAEALELIFGADQYRTFEDHPGATIGDIDVVLRKVAEAIGLNLGESSASPPS